MDSGDDFDFLLIFRFFLFFACNFADQCYNERNSTTFDKENLVMTLICNDPNNWYYNKEVNVESVHRDGDIFMVSRGNVTFSLSRNLIKFIIE